mmetsp:Transcript_2097/g.6515  ORF Transcript_2097/g.6515 Transcript_2097/m.6515 type:complete len:92 (-) Transcript_2097:457-732(-)
MTRFAHSRRSCMCIFAPSSQSSTVQAAPEIVCSRSPSRAHNAIQRRDEGNAMLWRRDQQLELFTSDPATVTKLNQHRALQGVASNARVSRG